MALLEKIWIEWALDENGAIRIDWDNDRHQRIPLGSGSPDETLRALEQLQRLILRELAEGRI